MADVIPIKKHKDYYRQTRRSVAGTLRQAKSLGLVEVLVIGVDAAGELQVQSSPPDPGNAFFLMEMARKKLTGGADGCDGY